MLAGKHLSRPPHSRLNLIGDEDDPLFRADPFQPLQVSLWGNNDPTFPENRFHYQSSYLLRGCLNAKYLFYVVRTPHVTGWVLNPKGTPVTVSIGDPVNLRDKGTES